MGIIRSARQQRKQKVPFFYVQREKKRVQNKIIYLNKSETGGAK